MKRFFMVIALCLTCAFSFIANAQFVTVVNQPEKANLEFVGGDRFASRHIVEYDYTTNTYAYFVYFHEYDGFGNCISPLYTNGNRSAMQLAFIFNDKASLLQFVNDMTYLIDNKKDAAYNVHLGRFSHDYFISYGNLTIYTVYNTFMGTPFISFSIPNKATKNLDLIDLPDYKLISTTNFEKYLKWPQKLIDQINAYEPEK